MIEHIDEATLQNSSTLKGSNKECSQQTLDTISDEDCQSIPPTRDIEDDENAFSNEANMVRTDKLYRVPLIPVDAKFGLVKALASQTHPLQITLRNQQKHDETDVAVLFAVRNVGCGGCREHALQMVELARKVKNVSVAAVVKKVNNDTAEDLITFHQEYFDRRPMYQDEKWHVFEAIGGGNLGAFGILRGVKALKKRLAAKNIASKPSKEDFWTKGGVLVFNRKGKVIFTHREKFGQEFDLEAIENAIQKARSTNGRARSGRALGGKRLGGKSLSGKSLSGTCLSEI